MNRKQISIASDLDFAYAQLDSAKRTLKWDTGISLGYIRSVRKEIHNIERRISRL